MPVRQKLGDIANIRSGYTFRDRPTFSDSGTIHLAQASDIQKWNTLDNPKLLPKIDAHETTHPLLELTDILLSARGRFHATVVANDDVPVIASSSLYIISLNKNSYHPHFIAMYINSPDAQKYFAKYAYGSNIKSLLTQTINELPLPKVSADKQTSLLKLHNAVMAQKEKLDRKEELLQQIFTATLSKSVKGALA